MHKELNHLKKEIPVILDEMHKELNNLKKEIPEIKSCCNNKLSKSDILHKELNTVSTYTRNRIFLRVSRNRQQMSVFLKDYSNNLIDTKICI